MPGGERGGTLVGQLLGVELDLQAMGGGGGEDALDLGGGEGDVLAEAVDGIGEAGFGSGGQDDLADMGDVAVLVAGEFGRQGMGGEQAGDDADAAQLAEAAGGAEHLQLVIER